MITKAEWEQMTPQAQWDLFQMMQAEIAALDESVDDDGATERVPVIDDEDMTYENGW